MKKLRNHLIGVDQGDVALFSDFQDGGEMWKGTGDRERRVSVTFREAFCKPPAVQTTVTLWDVDTGSAFRAELVAENITETGCEIVFRTWMDTRVARIRAGWTAIGELPHKDDWDIY